MLIQFKTSVIYTFTDLKRMYWHVAIKDTKSTSRMRYLFIDENEKMQFYHESCLYFGSSVWILQETFFLQALLKSDVWKEAMGSHLGSNMIITIVEQFFLSGNVENIISSIVEVAVAHSPYFLHLKKVSST